MTGPKRHEKDLILRPRLDRPEDESDRSGNRKRSQNTENGWSAIILTGNSFVLGYFVEAVVAGELGLNNFVKSDFVDFEKFQQEEALSRVHYKNLQQEIFFVFVM